MNTLGLIPICGLVWALATAPSLAQSTAAQSVDEVLASLGATTVRQASFDIALPADSAEYEQLGKNAVLMMEASSALAGELPLRSAYVVVNNIRVPLQRIIALPAREVTERRGQQDETYTHQVAFYLVPIYLLKLDAQLMVDFEGRRDGFSISRFPIDMPGAPTFIRADDYAYPSEPNMEAAATLIIREFPAVLEGSDYPK